MTVVPILYDPLFLLLYLFTSKIVMLSTSAVTHICTSNINLKNKLEEVFSNITIIFFHVTTYILLIYGEIRGQRRNILCFALFYFSNLTCKASTRTTRFYQIYSMMCSNNLADNSLILLMMVKTKVAICLKVGMSKSMS